MGGKIMYLNVGQIDMTDKDYTREWAGNDPSRISYRVARIISNVNKDLGPFGPMNTFRMAEIIYHEGLCCLNKKINHDK